jgi:hypothetical protein
MSIGGNPVGAAYRVRFLKERIMADLGDEMRNNLSWTDLEARLDGLNGQLRALKNAQHLGRIITLGICVLVILEFSMFAGSTTQRIEANFSDQNIQQAMAQHLPMLAPEVRDVLLKAGQNALPTYRELAMRKLKSDGPAIAADALRQLKTLPDDVCDEMQPRLRHAFDSAIARLAPDIRNACPTLADDQKRSVLEVDLYDRIDADNLVIAKRMVSIEDREKAQMLDILSRFDTPRIPEGTRDPARQRVFLHSLVDVLLDTNYSADLSKFDASDSASARLPEN